MKSFSQFKVNKVKVNMPDIFGVSFDNTILSFFTKDKFNTTVWLFSDWSKMIMSSVLDNNHLERDDYILSKVEQLKQEEFLKDVSDYDEVMHQSIPAAPSSTTDKKIL